MTFDCDHRCGNRLLDCLPTDVREGVLAHAQPVTLESGLVLHNPGDLIEFLYFPLTAAISITVTMREGKTSEAGLAGAREVVGINAFMGGRETTQTQYVVQVPGKALKVRSDFLRPMFDSDARVRAVLLHYTQAYIAQLSQNSACNRLHEVKERCARWLLETRDRTGGDHMLITHQFISEMLGVRRASATIVLDEFRDKGTIGLGRGWIEILHLEQIQKIACECYEVIRDEYDRLLAPA